MEKKKIAIIGGGMQGLSLAYFLSKNPDYSVRLFEKGQTLGGLLGLLEVEGTGLEGFYHHLANHDVDIIELIKELGLGDRLLYAVSKVGIFHDGRAYPFSTPWDLLRFQPLKWWERLRVGATALFLRSTKNYHRFEKITAEAWFKKYMGAHAYEVIWEPLLRGKFGSYKEQISMAWTWSRIVWRAKTRTKDGRNEELVYPRGGFRTIINAMVERIKMSGGEIKTGAVIDSVAAGRQGEVLVTAGGQVEVFDKVFVATPVNVFLRLVRGLPDPYIASLQRIRYRGAHVAVLVMNRSLMPNGCYWLSINDRSMPFLAVVEHTNLVPKADYGGKTIVYVGNYPESTDPIMKMKDDEVIHLYSEQLRKINPDFRPDWIEKYYVFKDPFGQPVVDTHYAEYRPAYPTPIENLYLVTMAQIYPDDRGTSKAVRQAKEVIKKLGL